MIAQAHPARADTTLAVLFLAVALLSIRVQIQAIQSSDPAYRLPHASLVLVVTLAAAATLAARRRFPLTVLVVTVAALIAARVIGSPEDDVGFGAVLVGA